MRIVTSAEMREMDRLAIEKIGLPGIVLMENAARGAAGMFFDRFRPAPGSRVLVFCGKGNNGGDGFAVARRLSQAALRPSVILLAPSSQVRGDALTNLEIIRRMEDIEVIEITTAAEMNKCRRHIEGCDYIIDAIFGTGLNSEVEGVSRKAIDAINSAEKPVMSIDIPSGLNADNGNIMGAAVKADLTVTFGFPKIGQLIFPGADLVGRLVCVDIGIPDSVAGTVESGYFTSEPDDLRCLLNNRRDIHKGDRGHLFVLAGSMGKTGAAAMTALGALRAGAGLVTVGIPAGLNSIMEVKLTEAMTVPLPETTEGTLSIKAKDDIWRLMKGKTAVAIGPGLSTNPETTALVREIVQGFDLPMVIDADGINALSEKPGILEKLDSNRILTPHPGEMARLTGLKTGDIQLDRKGTAERFTEKYRCCLVLKGARTIIAGAGEKTCINSTGNPALSSGGSGDVLTGIISGLLAGGIPAVKAAVAGVFLHGLAGDVMAEKIGETGVLAGDLPDLIPGIMDAIKKGEWPLKKTPPLISSLKY
jgi:ADP-dependent NAD(P)H-hydrate dehydratase / NAD(P)H-hydrate epimerase